jgi:hypothetical protein
MRRYHLDNERRLWRDHLRSPSYFRHRTRSQSLTYSEARRLTFDAAGRRD